MPKSAKQVLLTVLTMAVVLALSATWSLAADDPFADATEKTQGLIDFLKNGGFLTAICTLVVMIAGVALVFNRCPMNVFLKILAGCLIIGASSGVVGYFLTFS